MDQNSFNDISSALLGDSDTLTDSQWEQHYRAGMQQRKVQYSDNIAEVDAKFEAIPLFQTRQIDTTQVTDTAQYGDTIALQSIVDDVSVTDRADAFKLSGNETFQLAKAIKRELDKNVEQHTALQQQLAQPHITPDSQSALTKQSTDLSDKIAAERIAHKKRLRDALVYYQQGLNVNSTDRLVNSQLLLNCCKIYFATEQYRDCMLSAQRVINEYDAKSSKAYYWAAYACVKVNRFEQAQQYISKHRQMIADKVITNMNYNSEFDRLQSVLDDAMKAEQTQLAKQKKMQATTQNEQDKLNVLLQRNHLRVADVGFDDSVLPAKIRIVDDELVVPMLLCYPQYSQTDFIQTVHMHDTLHSVLSLVFPPQQAFAEWDVHHEYMVNNLIAYIETQLTRPVDLSGLQHKHDIFVNSDGQLCVRVYIGTLQQTMSDIYGSKLLQAIQYAIPGVPTIMVLPKTQSICACCQRIQNSNSFCSQCQAVSYCNRECQVKDWKRHKKQCKPSAAKR